MGCLTALLMMASCASHKDVVYFEDMIQDQGYPYDAKYEATVHANDRLSIVVSCRKPELAIPFNTHANSIRTRVHLHGCCTGPQQQRLQSGCGW